MPNFFNRKRFIQDAEFHIQIAGMTRNRVLVRMLKAKLKHIYLRNRLEYTDPEKRVFAAKEHRELIEKKDIPKCIEIIQHRIRRGRNNMLAGIAKEEESVHF